MHVVVVLQWPPCWCRHDEHCETVMTAWTTSPFEALVFVVAAACSPLDADSQPGDGVEGQQWEKWCIGDGNVAIYMTMCISIVGIVAVNGQRWHERSETLFVVCVVLFLNPEGKKFGVSVFRLAMH